MKRLITLSAVAVLLAASAAIGAETASTDVQKNFNVSKGGRLVVNVAGGDVSVKVWDKMQVQMTAKNLGDQADELHATLEGNTVTVDYHPHSGWFNSSRNLRFEFDVPQEFDLELVTSGGDLKVAGPLTGTTSMQTSGGDLSLEGISGEVDGKTSGGDITADDMKGKADLGTSGGDIHVGHAGGSLVLSTSGGDISVGTVEGDLKAVTSGGEIKIEKVGGNLSASTSSGNVTVGTVGGSVKLSTSGGDINLTSGTGRVIARTSGGDIDISNAVGSADASSSGGTVKVGLTPRGNERSRIESSGGDVYLFLPSDGKATINAEISGGDDDQITSDFPMTYKSTGDHGNRSAEFSINGGGQEIYLHTSSGNIHIQKLSASMK